jgi:hypothetical protein
MTIEMVNMIVTVLAIAWVAYAKRKDSVKVAELEGALREAGELVIDVTNAVVELKGRLDDHSDLSTTITKELDELKAKLPKPRAPKAVKVSQ